MKIEDVFGECPRGEWQRAKAWVEDWAEYDLPVLLHGERGVGKGLLARLLHAMSGRQGAFVEVNCATLSPSLVTGELFGAAKGSYTGADRDRDGYFVAADGGTLFLDEFQELPGSVQTQLNHAIEQRVIAPVGRGQRPVDVRVIGGTRTEPALAIELDLLDRFVGRLHVPALRDRGEAEIRRLADVLLAKVLERLGVSEPVHVARGALEPLYDHGWPGNVRELENVITRAVVARSGDTLTADDFAQWIDDTRPAPSTAPARERTCEEVIRELARQGEFAPADVVQRGFHPGYVSRTLRKLVQKGCLNNNGKARHHRRYWAVKS